ncbi:MAG TPA: phosphotransferase [Nocardioidaceae bacterium]|nr:phosphotransferase [Nocardioidaceae bacterium]
MTPEQVPPVPHGRTARRLEWQHLPPEIRAYVEQRLGAPVVTAVSQGSGYTPGFASRLTGSGGERVFVKAASKKAQRPFAEAYAEEARVMAALPRDLPAPRILWAHEDDGWVVLGFEDVEGKAPSRPWRGPELKACLSTLERVAAVQPPATLRTVHEELPSLVTGWQHVWKTRPDWPHLSEAASLAARLPSLSGEALVHCDARDDNFLLTAEGALLCDWNWPVTGPAWLDAVSLMISVHGDGGDAELALSSTPLTHGVDPAEIDVWLAAMSGFMLEARDRPVPPASPYLRDHQSWYAQAAWSWLASRRGWA